MIDFSKFKKVSENDEHAHFKHENGSELKVAKAGLSHKLKKQINGLPMYESGGDVPPLLAANDDSQDQSQIDTGVPGVNINIGAPAQSDAPPAPSETEMRAKGDYSDMTGGRSGFDKTMHGLVNDYPALAGHNGQGILGGYLDKPQDQAAMPSTPGGEVASNGPGLAGAALPPDAAAPASMDQSTGGGRGQAPPPISENVQLSPHDHAVATKNELMQESQNFQHDLDNGHITPKSYGDLFANKDTLGKIGTIFGLMLSGAGSGLARQPNMLMEMMNNEIKNDLEAQTKSATNKIDWYKANQQSILNQAQAKNLGADADLKVKALSNIQMNQAALHKLVLQSKNLPLGSPEREKADQVLAMLSQGVQTENFNLMDRAATSSAYYNQMFGGQGGGQEDHVAKRIQGMKAIGNFKAAEDIEKRYVPGVGLSPTTPVPDSARSEMVSKQKLLNTGNDLLEYSKTHSNIIPGTPEYRYGAAKAMAFQQEVREGLLGTVFRESEKPLLNKFVSENPAGALKAFNTQPKLRAILDTTKIGLNTLKKSYNLPQENSAQSEQQQSGGGNPYEGKTASDSSGNKIIMRNGQWVPFSNVAKK